MKKLKLIGCIVALAAIVGVNVWSATISVQGSDLSIADIEAEAQWPEGELWMPEYPTPKVGTSWGIGPNARMKMVGDQTYILEECMLTTSSPEEICRPVGAERWVPMGN